MDILNRARKLEEKTRSSILKHARRLEEKIQQRLEGTHVGEEPLEIWRGIAREIESQIQPVKSGHIFPYRQVFVAICATSNEKRNALRAAFDGPRLEQDIRQLLLANECEVPEDLSAGLRFTSQPGPEWKNPVFHVRYSRQAKATATQEPAPPRPVRVRATLRVTQGRASRATYTLVKDVTFIGRGSPKNDVVFEDSDDPVNSTVSRKHARIAYDEKDQTYVLYDEHSLRGTSILRGGRASKLPGGPRGRRLMSGDQILLGKAVIEFVSG
jgi:hypothetical protein